MNPTATKNAATARRQPWGKITDSSSANAAAASGARVGESASQSIDGVGIT